MILVGGENLIDLVQTGTESGYPVYKAIPGGSPYNTCIAVARQGQPTGYLTPISTDRLGDLLAERLLKDGISLLADRRDETSSLAVVSLVDGIPSYGFYREGTAERQVTAELLGRIVPAETSAFHVGSLALAYGPDSEVWAEFFLACSKKGVLTSLDPNVRPRLIPDRDAYIARITGLMAVADVLKMSDEDLEWFYPELDFDAGVDKLRSLSGAALTVVTRGAEGAIGWTAQAEVAIPAAPVAKMADTVGAGDTFSGTLIAQLMERGATHRDAIARLDRGEVATILATAARAAAINCGRQGCNPPYRNEL